MKSAKCSHCGFVTWADAESCKKCGAAMAPPASEYSYPSVPGSPNYSAGTATNQAGRSTGRLKTGLAITALVVGIVNFFAIGFLGIGTLVGVIISVVALRKIRQSPAVYGGKQLAVAGLITNIASIIVIIPFGLILAITIPNLLAARRAANEGSALFVIRRMSAAEGEYQRIYGKYATLDQLATEHLITRDLMAETRNGYKFKLEVSDTANTQLVSFQATAVPINCAGTGTRSFYTDETGVVRAANCEGGEANREDPPLTADPEFPKMPRTVRRRIDD